MLKGLEMTCLLLNNNLPMTNENERSKPNIYFKMKSYFKSVHCIAIQAKMT